MHITKTVIIMKQFILPVLLLICISASAQKTPGGYFSLRGGAAFKEETKGIAHMSVGFSPTRVFGIGAGVGFIQFDKPYIPLTVDMSFFGNPYKISPVIIGSAGYGIYEYNTGYNKVTGGFTGSLNLGVSFPVKKYTKMFLTGGYSIYIFSGGQNIMTGNDNIKAESSIKMFTVTAGFKI
jgi:hypothetical protein